MAKTLKGQRGQSSNAHVDHVLQNFRLSAEEKWCSQRSTHTRTGCLLARFFAIHSVPEEIRAESPAKYGRGKFK